MMLDVVPSRSTSVAYEKRRTKLKRSASAGASA
jgi:hypothetical protein